jgi:hypothetical protein
LQGFSLKNRKSLVQNRASGYAGNVSAQSIGFGTGPDNRVGLIDAIVLLHGIKNGSKICTLSRNFSGILPGGLKHTCNV